MQLNQVFFCALALILATNLYSRGEARQGEQEPVLEKITLQYRG